MNAQQMSDALQAMRNRTPGIRGCALVEASSGLVWQRSDDLGEGARDTLWEAAADYWRLHGRLHSHFDSLGELGAAVMYHHGGTLTVLPCLREPDLLLACIGDQGTVDWEQWQQQVRSLGDALRESL